MKNSTTIIASILLSVAISLGATHFGGHVFGAFNTQGSGAGLTVQTPVSISNGGSNTNAQTTNGVNYFDGTKITSGSLITFTGTFFGIGSTTPTASLQVATSTANATTTVEVGKANQTKGSCLLLYNAVGTAEYLSVQGSTLTVSATTCR